MKTQKLPCNKKPALTRELICKIGETLYQSKDVESVSLFIDFKDGSGITFRRCEVQEDIKDKIKKDSHEEEDD